MALLTSCQKLGRTPLWYPASRQRRCSLYQSLFTGNFYKEFALRGKTTSELHPLHPKKVLCDYKRFVYLNNSTMPLMQKLLRGDVKKSDSFVWYPPQSGRDKGKDN